MRTTIVDRLFLVVVVFLYSASLTCALAQCKQARAASPFPPLSSPATHLTHPTSPPSRPIWLTTLPPPDPRPSWLPPISLSMCCASPPAGAIRLPRRRTVHHRRLRCVERYPTQQQPWPLERPHTTTTTTIMTDHSRKRPLLGCPPRPGVHHHAVLDQPPQGVPRLRALPRGRHPRPRLPRPPHPPLPPRTEARRGQSVPHTCMHTTDMMKACTVVRLYLVITSAISVLPPPLTAPPTGPH